MWLPRLLTALVAPAGVVAAHAFAYSAAHGWEHERQIVLSGHGPVALLAGVALPLVFVAFLVVLTTDPRSGRPRWRGLAASQTALFATVEVLERIVGVPSLAEFLHDPAVWLGVAAQLATAALAVVLLQAADRLVAGALDDHAAPIARLAAAAIPSETGRHAPSPWLGTSLRRRGPPIGTALPVRS